MEVFMREIETTCSAFDIYSAIEQKENCIFLDSSKVGQGLGEFSIIGIDPFLTIKVIKQQVWVNNELIEVDFFEFLKEVIAKYTCDNATTYPYIGGGMGYFAYDLNHPSSKPNQQRNIPEATILFYRQSIIYNHTLQKVLLTVLNMVDDPNKCLDELERLVKTAPTNPLGQMFEMPRTFVSPFTKETYMGAVEAMREYIRQGDIYIGNMTHTYETPFEDDPFDTYKRLRTINPAPFSAYLPLDECHILCSSPERFLRIKNGQVETRPIKGTRPRDMDPVRDSHNRQGLIDSEKDRSELLMIVDLERNDLSKVCKPHGVKVTQLFEIETYATVFHLVATIIGQLEEPNTGIDCLKAAFPGGSITGTPKKRAMEIIDELEAHSRGIYTGSIGYLGFDGSVDLNIVIRTAVIHQGQATIGVGGGITWESEAQAEYQETVDKAKALFKALSLKEQS